MKRQELVVVGVVLYGLICALPARTGAQIFETHFTANFGGGIVGKYTTSGGVLSRNLISGFSQPDGIAVSGDKMFVVDASAGTVGE